MDDQRQPFVFDPYVRIAGDAPQQGGQVKPQLAQASRGRRSTQFTRLPPLGAVRAVDHDAWHGGETTHPQDGSHAAAGDHGEARPGGGDVTQDLADPRQRTGVIGVW